jgi:hypothetical protein
MTLGQASECANGSCAALPFIEEDGYNSAMKTIANSRVLERLFAPISSSLNDEAARKLIGLRADRQTQARVDQLARKCNEGELTSEERDEYETYVLAGEVIAIFQAQAKLMLARRLGEMTPQSSTRPPTAISAGAR